MASTVESLLNQGYQARGEHRHANAKAIYTEAIDLCTSSNDQPHLAQSLTGLGQIERDLGETDSALEHYQDAVAILRTVDEPQSLAHTVRHVGDILRESSQPNLALSCYEEALAIYRSHPETNTLDLANTLRGSALLQADLGNSQAAIEMWKEAGQLYNQVWQEPGSPFSEADLMPGILESQRQIALLSVH
jgi:tetratricopeptide (TPR) repeat protein